MTDDPVADQQGGQPIPVPAPAPAASGARLTRRELRAQEEARRAAEQGGGFGQRLRSLTGSVPVVRPQHDAPDTQQDEAAAPTTNDRAAAWRQTWGFGPTGDDSTGSGSNDGGNR
jgi:hypothetical protein